MGTNSRPLLVLHAEAARAGSALASQIRAPQLSLPTPCADWDLRQLLDHLTTENLGFAAAAAGRGADPVPWRSDSERSDPVGDYRDSVDTVVSTFARPGVLEQQFLLLSLNPDQTFPGSQAVVMHLIDSVVHAWDLAKTLDLPLELYDDVINAGLPMVEQIPDSAERREPGAIFGPAVPVPPNAQPLDRMVALLGRSPDWPR